MRDLNAYGPVLFRIFFGWAVGPLALSVPMFRNSMVFHSFDHISILAVHMGPPLVAYTMRWYSENLELVWPNTFHLSCSAEKCEASWYDLLFMPTIGYLLCWWIPYGFLMFVYLDAEDLKKKGEVTMYTYYETFLFPPGWFEKYTGLELQQVRGKDWSSLIPKLQPVVYMCLHFFLCFLAFALTNIFWHSFWAHTVYLILLVMVSAWNGATFYFKVMKKRILREFAAQQEMEMQKNMSDQKIIKQG